MKPYEDNNDQDPKNNGDDKENVVDDDFEDVKVDKEKCA